MWCKLKSLSIILKRILYSLVLAMFLLACQPDNFVIKSPDESLRVVFEICAGIPSYSVFQNDSAVIYKSTLGVQMKELNLSKELVLMSAEKEGLVRDEYTMQQGKRRDMVYEANQRRFEVGNERGEKMDIVFRVSNDGVAFRYEFPDTGELQIIENELTAFKFPEGTKMWMQPMSEAKTGWEHTNPSYEEEYLEAIPVGTQAPTGAGWVYPALFQTDETWVLITEAGLKDDYCGSRLFSQPGTGEMKIGFPSSREVVTGEGALPTSEQAWVSPWRVMVIGSLSTIVESTLGTDLADPAISMDQSWVKPGVASWSWGVLKDNSVNYEVTRQFIDYAASMNWQYCLVDADWDTRIGEERIRELSTYAQEKGIGLILWYNSAGDWNTTPYHPKSALLTHEQRVAEFSKLKKMGIKGVKIDFFGGDGQSMIAYYHAIMKDAADFELLVNFHGATLPRGWHRTYPHLMTAEAIKGFEFITFFQEVADHQPRHCSMLPFTRNVFDPMDFTPMCFGEIPNITRKTTNAFELALPTLFHSGIQHLVEIPESMATVPDYVHSYLSELPASWEDTRLVDGFPGKLVVLARKSGDVWYVTGINGEAREKILSLDLSFIGEAEGFYIGDGANHPSFEQQEIVVAQDVRNRVVLKPNGGFVMKLITKN